MKGRGGGGCREENNREKRRRRGSCKKMQISPTLVNKSSRVNQVAHFTFSFLPQPLQQCRGTVSLAAASSLVCDVDGAWLRDDNVWAAMAMILAV